MPKIPDLSKFSVDELKSIIKDAEKSIDKKAAEEKKEAKKAAEAAAKKHGFSLNDLVGGAPAPKSSKPKSPPKYKNPANPSQTWTGRGRQPAWIKEAIENGRPLEEFAI